MSRVLVRTLQAQDGVISVLVQIVTVRHKGFPLNVLVKANLAFSHLSA